MFGKARHRHHGQAMPKLQRRMSQSIAPNTFETLEGGQSESLELGQSSLSVCSSEFLTRFLGKILCDSRAPDQGHGSMHFCAMTSQDC